MAHKARTIIIHFKSKDKKATRLANLFRDCLLAARVSFEITAIEVDSDDWEDFLEKGN